LIGKELGLSFGEIGAIMTCQYLVGAISNVPGGLFVDMVGRKPVLMAVSLLWVGVPYLLMSFSHSYWMLLVCVGLIGFGNNLWHPVAIPLLADRFPDRKGLAVAFHGMGGNVGDAIAPVVAGALLTALTWRSVIEINVLPALAVAFLLLLYYGKSSGTKKAPDVAPMRLTDMLRAIGALFKNRGVLTISISSAFRTMTQTTLLTFLPVFLAGPMGYSPLWVGGCMFALQAAGFIAAPIAGHLSDRMGRRQIIMSSMLMTAVVFVAMAVVGQSPIFVLFVSVLGFFLFSIRAVMQAWLLDATPRNLGGSSIGILFGMQALGGAIGPGLGGVIADHYGLLATFYFLGGTIIIANLLIFITPFEGRKAA
jgi:MFS family permease